MLDSCYHPFNAEIPYVIFHPVLTGDFFCIHKTNLEKFGIKILKLYFVELQKNAYTYTLAYCIKLEKLLKNYCRPILRVCKNIVTLSL